MKGTVPASSFSCSADRQERRPGLPACRRPDRSRSTFRKTACCSKRAYWPANRPFPTKVRTTNLGPFGEVIRATGPMAKANPFRFSTKFQDVETDLFYYGNRYYNPSTGRWLGRDPMDEDGGRSLYAFVENEPVGRLDALGEETIVIGGDPIIVEPWPGHRRGRQLVRNPKLIIKKCSILILIGHGHLMPGEIDVEGGTCGYAGVYGCTTGGGTISLPGGSGPIYAPPVKYPRIPGAPKSPRREIDDTLLEKLANQAFEAAKTKGFKNLCKSKCGCKSVSITTQFLSSPAEQENNNDIQQRLTALAARNSVNLTCPNN